MPKLLIQDDEGNVYPALSDDGGQLIIRPDHDEKIISFIDTWAFSNGNDNMDAGEDIVGMTNTPAGMVRVYTCLGFSMIGTVTRMVLRAKIGGITIPFYTEVDPVSDIWYGKIVNIFTSEWESLECVFEGGALNDSGYFRSSGYYFKMPL